MRFTNRFFTLLMFIFAIDIPFAFAQSHQLIAELEQGTSKQKPVFVEGNSIWYGTEGSNIKVHYEFTAPTLDENQKDLKVTKVCLCYNGASYDIEEMQMTGEKTIPAAITPSANPVSVSLVYEFTEVAADAVETTKTDSLSISSNNKFLVFGEPVSEFDVNKAYTTSSVPLCVNSQGGSSTGWRYSWNGAEETSDNQSTATFPTDAPRTVITSVVVKNMAPDNSTVWFTKTFEKPVYFYAPPKISLDDESEKETNFYKNTSESLWKIKTSGGGHKWQIDWTGGAKNGQGETYCAFEHDVTKDLLNNHITVTARTFADDNHEICEPLAIDVATINVYSQIKHDRGNEPKPVFVQTSTAEFGPRNIKGGYPDGWTYSWDNSSEKTSTIKVVPSTTTTYKITATNSYNGKVWDSFVEEYQVKVFQQPSVTLNESLQIYDTKGNKVGEDKQFITTNTFGQKEQSVGGPYDNVIIGDRLTLSITPKDGVGEDWRYEIYCGKDKISDTNSAVLNFSQNGTYDIEVHAFNGENVVTEPYGTTFKHKFIVNDEPQFKGSNTNVHIPTTGSATKLEAPVEGGKKEGWQYIWSTGDKTSSIILPVDKSITSKKEFPYTVTVKYSYDGYTRFEETRSYMVTVWPEPKINTLKVTLHDKDINTLKGIKYYDLKEGEKSSIDVDCYDGDIIEFAYEVQGGYTGEQNCWTWKKASSETPYMIPYNNDSCDALSGSDNFTASSGGSLMKDCKLQLALENKLPSTTFTQTSSQTWKLHILNINLHVWQAPQVTPALVDSVSSSWTNGDRVDVYAGEQKENIVHFYLPHTGGYTLNNGWQYQWKEGATLVSTSDEKWDYVPSTNSDYTDKLFNVYIVNHIGDNYGLKESHEYKARVWKKIDYSNNVQILDENQNGRRLDSGYMGIREGNTIHYKVSPINYGYKDLDGNSNKYYSYIWSNNSDNTSYDWSEKTSLKNTEDIKLTEDLTFYYKFDAYGPYGHIWAGTPKNEYTYVIYNRPSTPLSLERKGNGTTGTMICTTSVSDKDLEGHEYYLVFGYQDTDGDHDMEALCQQNPGQVRWNSSFKGINGKVYVYSLWRYPGNIEITSGRRFLDTTDEEWDGSSYSGTLRQVVAKIAPHNYIEGVDEQTIEKPTNVTYYDLKGKLMGDSKANLRAGTYICVSSLGTKKIIIR